jgi:hypothetical protein
VTVVSGRSRWALADEVYVAEPGHVPDTGYPVASRVGVEVEAAGEWHARHNCGPADVTATPLMDLAGSILPSSVDPCVS